MSPRLITRATILGTGLIGGSFALALHKYVVGIRVIGWDRPEIAAEAQLRGVVDQSFSGEVAPALQNADLIYIALPIGATLDLLPEIARHAPSDALITDSCSTKQRITQAATELFSSEQGPQFLGGHPMAGKEVIGVANATADLFQGATYILAGESSRSSDPRINAFLAILGKIGARPMWLGAQQHDYAVGLASHLPQLASVALASFLYDHLDENGLPITVAGPGLRDFLRLAGSPYSTWRDIVLTNREVISAALDLLGRRLEDLRERLNSRDLEADFEAANDLYKLLRDL
jgi:prephenate dehydrogenase